MHDLTNAAGDVPEPFASTGRVLYLDQAHKLEPQRTVRSTCYVEKLAALSAEGQQRVERMEALLFEERRRVSSCALGDLHLPDCRFDCSEGVIWYHFSASKNLFVLSYFELHNRGGNRSGAGGGQYAYGGTRRLPCGWGEGIAARLSQLLTDEPAHSVDWVAWLEVDRSKPMFIVWIDDQEMHLDTATPDGRLLIDIAASCHLMRRSDSAPMVPSWSLLSRTTRVSEQLQNPYARSIFAGEALCRVGRELGAGGGRALRWGPFVKRSARAWRRCEPADLFAESTAILGAIRDGYAGAGLRSHACHYLTASLMDGDMLADVRRLTLIRSEMTYRLAMAISARTNRAHTFESRDVLRRYAMLSEFVRLSAGFFGVEQGMPAGLDVMGELDGCSHRDRAVIQAVVRDLDDFGSSTTMIVDQLAPPRAEEEKDEDSAATHARLCFLASEILCQSGAALS